MSRPPATPPAPQELSTQLLSATLAHELNNIVASLRGFVELGAEQAREQAGLQRILAEVRLGTERAAALASELEALAGRGAAPRSTPLLHCLAEPASRASQTAATPVVEWECDAQTRVLVDPVQVQYASSLLRRLGADPGEPVTALSVRTAPAGAPGVACTSCRAPVAVRSAWLIQTLPRNWSGQPRRQGRAPGHLSNAQWRLAVLAHAAHAAGGHVVLQPEPQSLALALVLPLA